jgi:hypothetical protein
MCSPSNIAGTFALAASSKTLGIVFAVAKKRGDPMSWSKRALYSAKVLPSYVWQRLSRRSLSGPVHLIFALVDHFEPYIDPLGGMARVSPTSI